MKQTLGYFTPKRKKKHLIIKETEIVAVKKFRERKKYKKNWLFGIVNVTINCVGHTHTKNEWRLGTGNTIPTRNAALYWWRLFQSTRGKS